MCTEKKIIKKKKKFKINRMNRNFIILIQQHKHVGEQSIQQNNEEFSKKMTTKSQQKGSKGNQKSPNTQKRNQQLSSFAKNKEML